MAGIYNENGIRFEYPDDWDVEVTDDGPVTTVALQAPESRSPAFALITMDSSCPAPAEVADEALSAMRDEYPDLDAVPALETIAGHPAAGHDVEFISLDLTNSCVIRCFRTPSRTVLVFGQWSNYDGDVNESHISGIRQSLAETDES